MKRNEFKLLLEDWKKNFIVESGLPPSNDELKRDLDYFNDGSFEKPGLDDPRHPSHMHSPDEDLLSMDLDDEGEFDHSVPSYDSIGLDYDHDPSFGMYPNDPPTEDYEDSHEFGDMSLPEPMADGDCSNEADEGIDEDPEEYGF